MNHINKKIMKIIMATESFTSIINDLPDDLQMKIYMFSTPRVSAHTKEAIGYSAGSWKTRSVLIEETHKWCMNMIQGGDHEHWIEHISNNMTKEELKEASKLLSNCLCCAKHSGSFGKTWENKTGTLLKPGDGWTRKGGWCECNCRHHRRIIDKALNMVDT